MPVAILSLPLERYPLQFQIYTKPSFTHGAVSFGGFIAPSFTVAMYQDLSTESFIDQVFVECFMAQNLYTAGPHDTIARILSVHTVK